MNEGQSRYADEGTLAYVAKLEQQLATCQAENLRLRTILGAVEMHVYDDFIAAGIGQALSTPPGDQSALREVIARVIIELGLCYDRDFVCAQLRSGEWTPEALK